jgi:hypothetical protein
MYPEQEAYIKYQYDVWGNEDDGYEVNDRMCTDNTFNPDDDDDDLRITMAKELAHSVFGLPVDDLHAEWEGAEYKDIVLYVNTEQTVMKPLCEFVIVQE